MSDGNSGCGGCLTMIVCALVIFVFCCGVTVDGKHYGVAGCDCDKGLEIDR